MQVRQLILTYVRPETSVFIVYVIHFSSAHERVSGHFNRSSFADARDRLHL